MRDIIGEMRWGMMGCGMRDIIGEMRWGMMGCGMRDEPPPRNRPGRAAVFWPHPPQPTEIIKQEREKTS